MVAIVAMPVVMVIRNDFLEANLVVIRLVFSYFWLFGFCGEVAKADMGCSSEASDMLASQSNSFQ